jgi:methanogenesis imperfect marker protein 11
LIVGVDDTDSPEGGATWSLSNELANQLENQGFADYLSHTITQLYTKNPWKTTNCVSIALTLATEPTREQLLLKTIQQQLSEQTKSPNTAIALYRGVEPPQAIREYALQTKMRIVQIDDARVVARENNIHLIPITGERGVIGALAALGYAADPDEAVKIIK